MGSNLFDRGEFAASGGDDPVVSAPGREVFRFIDGNKDCVAALCCGVSSRSPRPLASLPSHLLRVQILAAFCTLDPRRRAQAGDFAGAGKEPVGVCAAGH